MQAIVSVLSSWRDAQHTLIIACLLRQTTRLARLESVQAEMFDVLQQQSKDLQSLLQLPAKS